MAGYLKALAEALPPPPGRRYTLHFAESGSDVIGWQDALVLTVPGTVGGPEIHLIDGDFEKPVEQLVRETIDTIHRAAEVKRRQAEFDQMTGGRA